MKFSTYVVLAACAASTEAELRGLKKSKKMGKKGSPSKSMKMDLVAPEEENEDDGFKRYLKQNILTIEGLEPGTQLTDAEKVWLEDLILENLNKMDAEDTSDGIKEHHTILFSDHQPDRKLGTIKGPVDEYVYNEYICRYCPNDEDDWTTPPGKYPTEPPTKAPSSAPSDAPSVDIKEALKEANIGAVETNLCSGTYTSPLFRLRKITGCNLW